MIDAQRGPTEFSAWVWNPRDIARWRGFPTARLLVYRRELQIIVSPLGRLLRAAPDLIRYDWSAVVVQRLRPTGRRSVLVEIDAKLGSVAVSRAGRGRLRRALELGGFEVIEVERIGWEAPRAVKGTVLGAAVDRVPPCVVART